MAKTNRLEEMLSELGQKMDQFIEEMREQGEELSAEMREEMENLKEKMSEAADDSKGFTGKAKERWDNAKPHLDEAGKEIGQAFKRMVGK